VYNRPVHTRKTVDALLANHLSEKFDLVIFSDGPKSSEDSLIVSEVRNLISNIVGFRSVTVKNRPQNLGLANSIISGVTETLLDYESVIVLEDDMITSPYFLTFMRDGLSIYENDERVVSIHGYFYPSSIKLPSLFFIRGADCWGWATWRRGWKIFNSDGNFLYNEIKKCKLVREFNFNNSFDYMGMLKDQTVGKNDSWAIRWYASAFLANKLTLYPSRSFIYNIGLDNSGTHCSNDDSFNVHLMNKLIKYNIIDVRHSEIGSKAVECFFKSKKSYLNKLKNYIKNIVRK
jgi:hypothetical protein